MGGCDKTVPAMLMGAISADIPSIFMPAGPMLERALERRHAGKRQRRLEILGRTGGRQPLRPGLEGDRKLHRPFGGDLHDDGHGQHDGVRGRGDGIYLARCRKHTRGGRRTFAIGGPQRVAGPLRWRGKACKPSSFMTSESIDNGLMASLAIGGSTNAIVHLIAIAGRLGHRIVARSV